jgi:hypothetical protein
MSFPAGYIELLEGLAVSLTTYENETGFAPLLVGGAAAAIMTAGALDLGTLSDERGME